MIEPLIVYNKFFIEGKIPSFNELVFARAIQSPQKVSWLLKESPKKKKKKSSYVFNQYNVIKRNWEDNICHSVTTQGFQKVESSHFHYLVVENTKKRDPSNVFSAAIKFVEDGLMKAKVIDNDGWDNVLGIRPYIILDREANPGIFVVMASEPLSQNAIESYYNEWKSVNLVNAPAVSRVGSNVKASAQRVSKKKPAFISRITKSVTSINGTLNKK